MTVYRSKGCRTYRYDFTYKGQRYAGPTGQSKKRAGEDVERKIREQVERAAGGLPPLTPATSAEIASPKVQDWANVLVAHKARRGRKVAPLTRDLAVCLKFFGAPPAGVTPSDDEPYHDLRLAEIDHAWVDRFEQWLDARHVHVPVRRGGKSGTVTMRKTRRKIAASAKNHYRSAMSGLFRVALLAKHKDRTNVTSNPWRDVERDPTRKRLTMVTSEELRAWLEQSAYHVKLALGIAALAPKLRLANILSLRWVRDDVDLVRGVITVAEHKTARTTGLPLVAPITPVLAAILEHAHTRRDRRCQHVITYGGTRVQSLKTGLRNAARRAGLTYGLLRKGGVTFHTLRHYAATTLAELGVSESLRRETMGHTDLSTVQIYTHLTATHQRGPLEQLSQATPLADLFRPEITASRPVGESVGQTDRGFKRTG